ncbi:MAG TPA: DUF3857 domain-containing protein [Bacteroidia bacterium]|jgi:hypothetical protein|nr:DUF3857 domain-containing protein [Bacteroidia bacterium]
MKNRKRISILYVLFSSISLLCVSQDADEINKIRSEYPDANAILLKKTGAFKIYMEDNTLKGVYKEHEEMLINKETGIDYRSKSVPTSSMVEASNIKASILIPNGKKYKKKEVDKIEQKDDPDMNVFFDDQKIYSFTYPSAQVGAILNLDYQLTYKEPRFMGSHFWINYIPDLNNELKISVQKNINIQYKLFNAEGLDLQFTKEEKGNEVIYTWKSKSRKPITRYSDAPNFRYYEPHMVFYVTDYMVNGEKKKLLGTPKELLTWYTDIQKNLNKTEDKQLKKIADSLVTGISDEEEKVKKIFYWVQDNISYVAFEDGLGGFVPRDAGMVCSRKYGDCKDMASIINEMLRMVGVKSYLTWIGSRDIPYTYQDVPTPSSDNHMITSYLDKNNKWVFLDGTGKKAPMNVYTSFIQGKQALIGIAADSFQLATVPVKDTSVSQAVDSITIDIKDKIVIGKGKAQLTGYDALNYFYRAENKTKDELDEYFKNYFEKGNNKTLFQDVVMDPVLRGPVNFTYRFSVPDYVNSDQNEMYINLSMDKGLLLDKIEDGRTVPVSMKHTTKKRLVVTMNIPEGYKIQYLPQSVRKGNDKGGFSSTYEVRNNQLIHVFDFYINTLLLQPADFEQYNAIASEQLKASNQSISLIKIKP